MRTARPTGRPVIARAVDNDEQHVIIRPDGQEVAAALMAFEEHDMGRMRAGYICVNCYEDLDTAFPDHCPVCRFPMAARQAERLAKEFVGTTRVGPSTTLDEEREIMNEMRARRRAEEQGIWTPSITVPRGI